MSGYISEKRDENIYIYRIISTVKQFGQDLQVPDASISASFPSAATTLIKFEIYFTDDENIYKLAGVYTKPLASGEWCRVLDLNDIDLSDLDPDADNPYQTEVDSDSVMTIREYYEWQFQTAAAKVFFDYDLTGYVERGPEEE